MTTTHTIAATLLALCTAVVVILAPMASAQACGPYGGELIDDNTKARWAVEDHLLQLGHPQVSASAANADPQRPHWAIAQVEVLAGQVALVQVTWTANGQTRAQLFTALQSDNQWRVIGKSSRLLRIA